MQVPSAKCQVPSAKCQVPCPKCQVPSAKYHVPSAKCQMPSAKCKCQVPSAKCQVTSAIAKCSQVRRVLRTPIICEDECPKLSLVLLWSASDHQSNWDARHGVLKMNVLRVHVPRHPSQCRSEYDVHLEIESIQVLHERT